MFCVLFFTHERVNKFRNSVQSSFIIRFTFLAVLIVVARFVTGAGGLLFLYYIFVCFRRWIGVGVRWKFVPEPLGGTKKTQKKTVSCGIVRRNEVFYVFQKIKTNDEHLSFHTRGHNDCGGKMWNCLCAKNRRQFCVFKYTGTSVTRTFEFV